MQKNIAMKILFAFLLFFLLPGCSNDAPSQNDTQPVVGIINLNQNLNTVVIGFKKGMAEQGYLDGKNIRYLYNGEIDITDVDAQLREMKLKNVDLIFTLTTPATLKAKKATVDQQIPIVFAPVFSPVESGIVTSLTKPGGNLTGIQARGSASKAVGWFLTLFPEAKNIYVPFHTKNKSTIQSFREFQKEAEKRGLNLIVDKITNPQELKSKLQTISNDTDGIWLLNSHFIVSNFEMILEKSYSLKIPIAAAVGQYAIGTLISYGPKGSAMGKQASRLATKILQGISPATLPVETAEFFLGINLPTAKAIDFYVPDEILMQADFIVR